MDKQLIKLLANCNLSELEETKTYISDQAKLVSSIINLVENDSFDVEDIHYYLIKTIDLALETLGPALNKQEPGKIEFIKLIKLKLEKSPELLNLL